MKPLAFLAALTWAGLWLTPDQQGAAQFARAEYEAAAAVFRDPLWQGTAWFRAGEFDKAAQAFARLDTPEGQFNQGNALVLQGKYDSAIASYDRAIELRPDWQEARDNRDLAAARAELIARTGGEMGDQRLGADDILFDSSAKPGGQDTELISEQSASDATVQALWLRRVQTRPAEFLRAKFAYQNALDEGAAR